MIRKLFLYCGIIFMLSSVLCSCAPESENISKKLIRFHVIANSDSEEDQSLKLKVRDKILKEIGPKLEVSKSKQQSEDILNQNLDLIKSIAEKEIKRNGKKYDVAVNLGKSSFPTKVYSNIALPAGEYDALKVVIGKGEGKNWWCVMFPPLCFIDITKGVTSEDTEKRLKTVLNDNEYDSILSNISGGRNLEDKNTEAVKKPVIDKENTSETSVKRNDNVEIKFKSVEVVKSLFSKVENLFQTSK